jgi:hypothetical protein
MPSCTVVLGGQNRVVVTLRGPNGIHHITEYTHVFGQLWRDIQYCCSFSISNADHPGIEVRTGGLRCLAANCNQFDEFYPLSRGVNTSNYQ